jgi:hypothetical protein
MDAGQPRAGHHRPRSTGEFQSWFATDADCLDYLEWLRWPDGFVSPRCGHAGGWAIGDGWYKCPGCGKRTSVTAGTLFDRRCTLLTVWCTACWVFASGKDGVSALSLQRALEIGSYATAWAMLHRLRSVLVRPGRDRLTGTVEIDETFIGGEEPGLGVLGYDRDDYGTGEHDQEVIWSLAPALAADGYDWVVVRVANDEWLRIGSGDVAAARAD